MSQQAEREQLTRAAKLYTSGTIGRFHGQSNFWYAEAECVTGLRVHAYNRSKRQAVELLRAQCRKEIESKQPAVREGEA